MGGVSVGLVDVKAMREMCNLSNPIKIARCEILREPHKDMITSRVFYHTSYSLDGVSERTKNRQTAPISSLSYRIS